MFLTIQVVDFHKSLSYDIVEFDVHSAGAYGDHVDIAHEHQSRVPGPEPPVWNRPGILRVFADQLTYVKVEIVIKITQVALLWGKTM